MKYKIIVITIFIIVISNISGFTETINNRIYDNFIIFNQLKDTNNDIVIISIDSKSINEIGYWPWRRSLLATAIRKIIKQKPAVLGINLSFSKTQGFAQDDKDLYSTLKSFPESVLARRFIVFSKKKLNLLVPDKTIFPDIISSHVLLDKKDVIRRFAPFKVIPAFSLMVLKQYYANNSISKRTVPSRLKKILVFPDKPDYSINEDILIDYQRAPDKFKKISFVDVLNDTSSLTDLKDKIVLIGIDDNQLITFFLTPFSTKQGEDYSSSVEIQAQIIDSLMHFRDLKEIPFYFVYLISFFIAVGFFSITIKRKIILQGLTFVAFVSVILFLTFALFKYSALWFPPAIVLILIVVIFSNLIFFTADKVDHKLISSINNLKNDEGFTLLEVPEELHNKFEVLDKLTEVIRKDRLRIKSIINNIFSGIFLLDNQGKILWTNEFSLTIFQNHLVLENNINHLIDEVHFSDVLTEISEKSVYKKELIIKPYEFILYIQPTIKNDNEFVAILYDVTELKEIDRLKTNMIRMVSHEIKTPIMNIILATEALSIILSSKNVSQHIDIINKSADNIISTINNFLNLNKIETNSLKSNLNSANLIYLLENCIDIQNVLAEKRGIEIQLIYDDIPFVMMDEKLIEIVINNLLSNAIKYSSDNSKIIIKMEKEDTQVLISIIDNGIGIPADELDNVFEKFYRSTNNENLNVAGTGLGLAIVKAILNLHNSDIFLQSEYHKGSTFSFKLQMVE